jgi:hypothetical protein
VFDKLFSLIEKLQPLRKKKNPNVAAGLAFFFGIIGMLIYGMSFIDIVFGIAFVLVATLTLGQVDPVLGFLVGMLVGAIYSYFRVLSSNRNLNKEEIE